MIRIGITGPIACGKSTVADWLEELGAVVIDADAVAREVTALGEPVLDAILERFGDAYRQADGSLDRTRLGRHVFADPAALHDLEAIVHPAVRAWIGRALLANEADEVEATVIEAIKLVEGGLADWCDEVWLVTCDPAVQRERLLRRDSRTADADQRIAAQGDVVQRVRHAASRVIDTSGDLETTRRAVVAAWADLGLTT